MNEDMVA